ncbi:MAG TPA: MarR family transcriptional regulator [Collinsella ihuae]|uniref:MarR family transcriptional regulator n=1 Tax=Collinsella ihumii TaxID=1720204 RepID=A0A921ITL8_9ACTN|nr:MarR family transcriptional regulator [Collinsella ihumii]
MMEVHTLTYIEEHPGTTITELAAYWHKTKSALSQLVTWLSKQGLVEKRRRENNARVVGLFPTERGIEISREHKRFDIADIEKTNSDLLKTCSQEEIDAFYKVLGPFNGIIRHDFEINAGRRGR